MEPRRRRITLPARGGSVAALEFGPQDRPVDVVFSHANGFNALTYRHILKHADPGLRILAYDLRGHGASDLPADPEGRPSWDDLAEDLQALLAAEDLTDVRLAGHSMGATTSLLAAAQAPQRVRDLVLFDPVILPKDGTGGPDGWLIEGALRRRNAFASREAAVEGFVGRGAFATWPREMIADYVAAGLAPTADGDGFILACAPAWEVSNYKAQGHDSWGALERTRRPIRIFRAERGSVAWIEDQAAALTAGGRVRIETTAGTTHFLPMERPELAARALEEV